MGQITICPFLKETKGKNMKLQHLAIIFVIIMLPISMVITSYIQSQIDTISLQTRYSLELQTATHDAIKAFQLNTLNNKYSTVSDSKIRDIEASISTFYNSLGTELGASGYSTESLQEFIPAIVYTMYDGYYIYGKYYNDTIGEYQYGLKPYIYYSCRYVKGTTDDFVVNYTLDNGITIYGKVKGTYETKSGTLINPNLIDENSIQKIQYQYTDRVGNSHTHEYVVAIKYDDVTIEREILKEQLITLDENNNPSMEQYEYVNYSNRKVYKDNTGYFWNTNNKKQYITDEETLKFAQNMTINGHLYSNSAAQYYADAYEFSKWVTTNLNHITQEDSVDSNGNKITDFAINTGTDKIFELSNRNNPLLEDSTFNQNRVCVIRKTIQTTLNTAIANYSSNASYEFSMPIFTEEDWEKLVNNIAVASFMQGLPIGGKYFNNYCIITNNKNKEIVTKESIYIITDDNQNGIEENTDEVHKASSREVIDGRKTVIGAYKNTDFEMQTVVITEGNERYFYPHANNKCYDCMVNVAETYNIDDVIDGTIKVYNNNLDAYEPDSSKDITILRKIYLTALARERYDLYKTNGYFGV